MEITPRPLGPHVLVQPLSEPEMTPGGIVLPQEVFDGDPSQRGMVIEVAAWVTEAWTNSIGPLEPGDTIIWPKGRHYEVIIGRERLAIVHASNILVRLEASFERLEAEAEIHDER